MSALQIAVFSVLYLGLAYGYPSGAPASVCQTMLPSVTFHGGPQNGDSPYTLSSSHDHAQSGDMITVKVEGPENSNIRGILLQARDKKDGETIVGQFILGDDTNFKYLDCNGENSAVTHTGRTDKPLPITFTWKVPDMVDGIHFVATIVEVKEVFYTFVESPLVTIGEMPTTPHSEPEPDSCSATDTWKAAACATQFKTDMEEDYDHLWAGHLDLLTFCSQIEHYNQEFSECSDPLMDRCESIFVQSIEYYRNTTYVYCDCNMLVNCFADPCDNVIPPPNCPGATCMSKFCGGCWAIWMDKDEKPCTGYQTTTYPVVYPPSAAVGLASTHGVMAVAGMIWMLLGIYF